MNERQPTANSGTQKEILQTSFPAGGVAVVIGATGAVGNALTERLSTAGNFTAVVGLSRTGSPALDDLRAKHTGGSSSR
jgi:NAD(P)-dependent dehydrogenase (short-subunit alcohol dehydrogenase family)